MTKVLLNPTSHAEQAPLLDRIAEHVPSAAKTVEKRHPLQTLILSSEEECAMLDLEWEGLLAIDIAKVEDLLSGVGDEFAAYLDGVIDTRRALTNLLGPQSLGAQSINHIEAINYCRTTFDKSEKMRQINTDRLQDFHLFAACEVCCMALLHLEPSIGRDFYERLVF